MTLEASVLTALSATDARARLVAGEFSATEYAQALLMRVDEVDAQVQAWAHLDAAHLLAQAEAADESHALGEAAGALFGVPVGMVALWATRSERELKGKGHARIMLEVRRGAEYGRYHVSFSLENTGLRPLTWTNVAWRVGWLRFGPKVLKREWALQNVGAYIFVNHTIEPTSEAQEFISVADLKAARDEQSEPYFCRRIFLLGLAPISAFAIVRGRRPIRLTLSRELKRLLQTGEHPDAKHLAGVEHE